MTAKIQQFATQAGLQPFEDSGPGYVAKMTKFGELAWSDGFQAGLAQVVQAQMSNPVYKQAMDEYYQRIWAHRFD